MLVQIPKKIHWHFPKDLNGEKSGEMEGKFDTRCCVKAQFAQGEGFSPDTG